MLFKYLMRSIIFSFQLFLNLSSMYISHVSFFLFSLCHYNVASHKISLGPFIMYHMHKSCMVASKILLLLSSANATIGGEQVITQTKCKWDKFNHATVIDYVCKFLLSVFYCSGVK